MILSFDQVVEIEEIRTNVEVEVCNLTILNGPLNELDISNYIRKTVNVLLIIIDIQILKYYELMINVLF